MLNTKSVENAGNIMVEFPDAAMLKSGEWSEYGKLYELPGGGKIEISLYREPEETGEYDGRLTLHVFYNDEVLGCFDAGE